MKRILAVLLSVCLLGLPAQAEGLRYCARCGIILEEGAASCPYCGWTEVAEGLKDGEWACPCGLVNDANFCGRCGRSRGEAAQATPLPERAQEMRGLKAAQAGDVVTYGRYPQTADGGDETPVEWLVLDRDGDTLTLVSLYALDCVPFNKKGGAVTWETSSLREWLNGEFLKRAFDDEERAYIVPADVPADGNPKYPSMPAGNATRDSAYLLSVTEAMAAFKTPDERACAPTAYAKARGARDGACLTWLRTSGYNAARAACVYYDGRIHAYGYETGDAEAAVRPAIRVAVPD